MAYNDRMGQYDSKFLTSYNRDTCVGRGNLEREPASSTLKFQFDGQNRIRPINKCDNPTPMPKIEQYLGQARSISNLQV